MTKYYDLAKGNKEIAIKKAGNIIKTGGLVLFPTETVYGIGADGLNEEAVKKIFIAKGRAQDNPLILHVSDKNMIEKVAKNITNIEKDIIDKFMPGPLTIILKKRKIVPDIVSAGLDTVGIRMPEEEIARNLIKEAKTPLAAPSANISGKPSGTNIKDIFNELNNKVDIILDNGPTKIGVESTVIRVIKGKIHILRPGKITKEDFENLNYKVIIDKHILNKFTEEQKVLSPGVKYKHYAPNSKCILIYSKNNNKIVKATKEISKKYKNPLILCTEKNKDNYKNPLIMGETLEEISKNIFTILRKVDNYNPDIVIIEGVKSEGLGLAIMNRLIRACSYNYIEPK